MGRCGEQCGHHVECLQKLIPNLEHGFFLSQSCAARQSDKLGLKCEPVLKPCCMHSPVYHRAMPPNILLGLYTFATWCAVAFLLLALACDYSLLNPMILFKPLPRAGLSKRILTSQSQYSHQRPIKREVKMSSIVDKPYIPAPLDADQPSTSAVYPYGLKSMSKGEHQICSRLAWMHANTDHDADGSIHFNTTSPI